MENNVHKTKWAPTQKSEYTQRVFTYSKSAMKPVEQDMQSGFKVTKKTPEGQHEDIKKHDVALVSLYLFLVFH